MRSLQRQSVCTRGSQSAFLVIRSLANLILTQLRLTECCLWNMTYFQVRYGVLKLLMWKWCRLYASVCMVALFKNVGPSCLQPRVSPGMNAFCSKVLQEWVFPNLRETAVLREVPDPPQFPHLTFQQNSLESCSAGILTGEANERQQICCSHAALLAMTHEVLLL